MTEHAKWFPVTFQIIKMQGKQLSNDIQTGPVYEVKVFWHKICVTGHMGATHPITLQSSVFSNTAVRTSNLTGSVYDSGKSGKLSVLSKENFNI
jgi:hypothetical protein